LATKQLTKESTLSLSVTWSAGTQLGNFRPTFDY
jgi:hypothetical protein